MDEKRKTDSVALVLHDDQTAPAEHTAPSSFEVESSAIEGKKYSSLTQLTLHSSNPAWAIFAILTHGIYAFSLFLAVHMLWIASRVLFQDIPGDFELMNLASWLALYSLFSGVSYGACKFVSNRMKLKFERLCANSFWSNRWQKGGSSRRTESLDSKTTKEELAEATLILSDAIFDTGIPKIYLGIGLCLGCVIVIGVKSAPLCGYTIAFCVLLLALEVIDSYKMNNLRDLPGLSRTLSTLPKEKAEWRKTTAFKAHNHTCRDVNLFFFSMLKHSIRMGGSAFFLHIGENEVEKERVTGSELSYCLLHFIFLTLALVFASSGMRTVRSVKIVNATTVLLNKLTFLPARHVKRTGSAANRKHRQHKHSAGQYIFAAILLVGSVGLIVGLSFLSIECKDAKIVCEQNGAHCSESRAVIRVPQSFSIKSGCSFDEGVRGVLDTCAETFSLSSNASTADEENFLQFDDVLGEDDAAADILSASSAKQSEQMPLELCTVNAYNSDLIGRMENKHHQSEYLIFYQHQGFTVDEAIELALGEAAFSGEYELSEGSNDRRVLEETNTASDESDVWTITRDEKSAGVVPGKIELTVGSGRFDGSKDTISMRVAFAGDLSEYRWITLGNGWKKGETRQIEFDIRIPDGDVDEIVLVSSGKDGVKFSSMKLTLGDEKIVKSFIVKTFLKCRGSKRRKTYTCQERLKPLLLAGKNSIPVCQTCDKASQKPKLVALQSDSFIVNEAANGDQDRFKKLTYSFGSLWMDCSKNGAARFEYSAFCGEFIPFLCVR